jgi:hypothetical protein
MGKLHVAALVFLYRRTPFLLASFRRRDKSPTNKAVSSRTSHTILTYLIILALVLLTGAMDKVNAQVLAQQLPGEVLQQMERDRQQQELLKKQEQQKKPPVIIEEEKAPQKLPEIREEDRKEPMGEKPRTDGESRGDSEQDRK